MDEWFGDHDIKSLPKLTPKGENYIEGAVKGALCGSGYRVSLTHSDTSAFLYYMVNDRVAVIPASHKHFLRNTDYSAKKRLNGQFAIFWRIMVKTFGENLAVLVSEDDIQKKSGKPVIPKVDEKFRKKL